MYLIYLCIHNPSIFFPSSIDRFFLEINPFSGEHATGLVNLRDCIDLWQSQRSTRQHPFLSHTWSPLRMGTYLNKAKLNLTCRLHVSLTNLIPMLSLFWKNMRQIAKSWHECSMNTPLKTNMELEHFPWKRRTIYKPPIFEFHGSFRGCKSSEYWMLSMTHMKAMLYPPTHGFQPWFFVILVSNCPTV